MNRYEDEVTAIAEAVAAEAAEFNYDINAISQVVNEQCDWAFTAREYDKIKRRASAPARRYATRYSGPGGFHNQATQREAWCRDAMTYDVKLALQEKGHQGLVFD